jgi:hypothetical protein
VGNLSRVLGLILGLSGCTEITGFLSRDLIDGVPQEGRRVFLTTISGNPGDFALTTGSIDGPCVLARNAAGLKRDYVAILSTSTIDAKDRVVGDRKIYKLLGADPVLVADNAEQMWSGSPRLHSPIDTDEYGVQQTSVTFAVWTGSLGGGTFEALRTCADWTDRNYGSGASIGNHQQTSSLWIRSGTSISCDPMLGLRGIYCISI